jgi:hypothetical protein
VPPAGTTKKETGQQLLSAYFDPVSNRAICGGELQLGGTSMEVSNGIGDDSPPKYDTSFA